MRNSAHHFDFANIAMIDGRLTHMIVGVSSTRRVSVAIELVYDQEVIGLKCVAKFFQARRRMLADDLMDGRTRAGRHVHSDEKFHVDLQVKGGASRSPPRFISRSPRRRPSQAQERVRASSLLQAEQSEVQVQPQGPHHCAEAHQQDPQDASPKKQS